MINTKTNRKELSNIENKMSGLLGFYNPKESTTKTDKPTEK